MARPKKKADPDSSPDQPAPVKTDPTKVALSGELTTEHVAQVKVVLQLALAAVMADPMGPPMVLNLSAVTEFDGAGLQLLLALARAAQLANTRVELLSIPPNVKTIFDSYGVAGQFTMKPEGATS